MMDHLCICFFKTLGAPDYSKCIKFVKHLYFFSKTNAGLGFYR